MTNHGCGFASWGDALRQWRTVAVLLIVSSLLLLLSACLPLPPIRRMVEATPTPVPAPSGNEFYRGLYASCFDALTTSGVGDTAVLTLCESYTNARRQAEWHATEWPGYQP